MLKLSSQQPSKGGDEPKIIEYRGAQVGGEGSHPVDGLIDERDAVAELLPSGARRLMPRRFEGQADGGEKLPEVVVQLTRQRASLRLLGRDEAPRKRLELFTF